MLRRAVVRNLKHTKVDLNKLVKQQVNQYHITSRAESTLILGGLGLAATGIVLQYGLKFYQALPKAGDPAAEPKEGDAASESQTKAEAADASASSSSSSSSTAKESTKESTESSGGFFANFFSGKGYYEGGFEEKMTKREAALILGVRESATLERIKDAHRKILLLNHPDRGGSALLAAKINEAKDLLIKGKV